MGKTGAINEPSASAPWTGWRTLPEIPPFSPPVLAELLDGGQAFRWYQAPGEAWVGIWSGNVVQLRIGHAGLLEWSAPAELARRVARDLPAYLGATTNFAAQSDALPWRSDAHLARCIEAFRGLRLLRQPFGETLLGFLCSATKQIVQIKQMLALLAQRHGQPICPATTLPTTAPLGSAHQGQANAALNRLPTWEELAVIPETELRQCLLGFRARYISETARFLARHPTWLEETEKLPYAEAKARLCHLPGVGEKVADCVLLFGAGRLEAFPVDVWILKTMADRYHLHGWKPPQLAEFGRVHFGPAAGLAQQYLFAWERRFGSRRRPSLPA